MADKLSIPASGAFIHQMSGGQEVVLGFSPETTNMDLAKDGNDLRMAFENGSEIVLKDFFSFLDARLDLDGVQLDAEAFLAAFAPDLATAAGDMATGRLNAYADDAGNLMGGVNALGAQEGIPFDGGTALRGWGDESMAPEHRETTISITTQDVYEADGGTVIFRFQLSLPPTGAGSTYIMVEVFNSVTGATESHSVRVDANGYGELPIKHLNDEDIYLDRSHVTATVVGVTGGNYNVVTTGQTATAHIIDTIDPTTANIEVVEDGHGGVIVTVTLSNPIEPNPAPQSAVTFKVWVDGESYDLTIPKGEISNSITVDDVLKSDAYGDREQTVKVSLDVPGPNAGNFEDWWPRTVALISSSP